LRVRTAAPRGDGPLMPAILVQETAAEGSDERTSARPASAGSDGPRPAVHAPVLIVEDDADLREMMAQLLQLEGFDARSVSNGREALEYLKEGAPPQLILLDMMMPVMDGWEVLRQQQRDPKIAPVPVIVLSALDQPRIGDVGAIASLKKPLDFDRLLDLVRAHCHRSD